MKIKGQTVSPITPVRRRQISLSSSWPRKTKLYSFDNRGF